MFPWWLRWQRIHLQCGTPGLNPWIGKIPWRRAWQPTPVFLPGESPWTEGPGRHNPWGCKKSDTTEWLSTWTSTHLLTTELVCSLFSHQWGLPGPPCLSSVASPNPHQTVSFSSNMVSSWPYYLAYWSFLASLHYHVPWGDTAEVCLPCLLSPKWVLSKYLLTKSLPLLKLAFS